MEKTMETVVEDTLVFIKAELGHHLPAVRLVSSLE
jgi:hypothetical protein